MAATKSTRPAIRSREFSFAVIHALISFSTGKATGRLESIMCIVAEFEEQTKRGEPTGLLAVDRFYEKVKKVKADVAAVLV
jgi:hypothetical protein